MFCKKTGLCYLLKKRHTNVLYKKACMQTHTCGQISNKLYERDSETDKE